MTTDAETIAELYQKPRSVRMPVLFDFEPFDYQADLLDKSEETDIVQAAVKPGRQVGKTLTGGAIAADEFVKGKDVMILGPYEDTVREMMDEFKNHVQTCKQRVESEGLGFKLTTENELEYESAAGGRCRARTVGSTGTQVRGKNPEVVLVDEAAYVKDKIFTEVIEPFFSTHESWQFYLFSTPAGTSGYFYDAVEGRNADEWHSPHWPSRISPLISEEFLERKKRDLDSITFQQEYEGEFVDEGDSYLPHNLVKPCIVEDPQFVATDERFLGVDIARKGKDRTVYLDIDKSGVIRNIWHEETSTVPGVAGRIKNLHDKHNYEAVLVDENAVGGGVVDAENLQSVVTGVTFSTQSKHQMYTNLKTAFENEALTIPANHDERRRLVSELTALQFSFTANGYLKVNHPPGGHDDYADALALANHGRSGHGTAQVTRRRGTQTRKINTR